MSHRALSEQLFGQLAMFHTAGEIKERWDPASGDKWAVDTEIRESDHSRDFDEDPVTSDEVWDWKKEESDYAGITDSVRDKGVIEPVSLGVEQVMNGHHRVAAAREDQLIPVVHVSSSMEAHSGMAYFDRVSKEPLPAFQTRLSQMKYDRSNPSHKLVP